MGTNIKLAEILPKEMIEEMIFRANNEIETKYLMTIEESANKLRDKINQHRLLKRLWHDAQTKQKTYQDLCDKYGINWRI